MKLASIVALALCGFALITSTGVRADDDVVSGFSIDEPNGPEITPTMLAKSRGLSIAHADALLHNAADPSAGSPLATVVLVDFMDFKCPLSERMDPTIQALVAANPSFRVVFKIVPIHGEVSVFAAKAALAAKLQGKYLEYHKALMKAGKTLTHESIIAIAKGLGIDTNKLKSDMNSPEIAEQLDANMKLFHAVGLFGTPDLLFVKYNLTTRAKNNDVVLMLGEFAQPELQNVVDDLIQ